MRSTACKPWSDGALGTSAAVRIRVHSACSPWHLPLTPSSLPHPCQRSWLAGWRLLACCTPVSCCRRLATSPATSSPTHPAGFPTASVFGDQVFKFTELQGQGIEGEDLVCDASIVPGKCVLPIAGEAALVCHAMGPMCRAVTVYLNGAHKNGMASGNSKLGQPAMCHRLGCGNSLLEPAG